MPISGALYIYMTKLKITPAKENSSKGPSRFDKGEIRNAYFTSEGFLRVDAIVTRTGVFLYRNPDGTIRKELRHPDDILKKDSLSTMEMIPVALLHPADKEINASNSRTLSVGFTGQKITIDGKYIISSFKVTDESAINAIVNDGVKELSLGYRVALVDEVGEYGGESYDFRQTDVVYNHLAIVPQARAGSEARIELDAADAIQETEFSTDSMESDKNKTDDIHTQKPNKKETVMTVKISLDGIEYDTAPEVKNALSKATARGDEAEAKVTTLNDDNSKLQAKLDEADEKIKKLEARDDAAAIKTAVDSRLALISQATPHLDEETIKKVADMSDKDIKVAVIKKHFPEANLDGKDDTYIQARYDGAIEMKVDSKDENKGSSIADQRQSMASKNNSDSRDVPDMDKSRKQMHADIKDAWKNPVAK